MLHTVVTTVLDWLSGLHGAALHAVVAALAFSETAVGLDLIVPGETGMALAGLVAQRNGSNLVVMVAVGIVGAILGDTVGYVLGRRWGRSWLLDHERVRRRLGPKLERSEEFFDRHGGRAVFLGRWVGGLRAVMAFTAGMSEMRFGRFLAWNTAASIAWVTTLIVLGYTVGNAFVSALKSYGSWITWGLAAVIVIGFAVQWWRKHPDRRRELLAHVPGVAGGED